MAARPFHTSDLVLGSFVIAIVAMLFVPLPTPLLDLLLVSNLSIALLLLLAGLYMPNALALLSFPSLLLLTTLFRLALNVASTRLILSQGEAGQVIQAFGTFLIRGEVMVGVVIFTIITVVNFIVIAKGAARVSEVAARFALDALPGKQLTIDSDLRAGLITNERAQQRRDELRKESQLYGAMDGAMRFVQGDAIAGFFIIFTNILGGLYLGISRGDSLADAVQRYTTLTVGDGLVSQIPALLISICAGIVVTRVSSGENTTLGTDVGRQLFARPGTMLFAGALLIFVGTLHGLPTVPFFTIGSVLMATGFWLRRNNVFLESPAFLALDANSTGGAVPLLGHHSMEEEAAIEASDLVVSLDALVLHRLYRLNSTHYARFWSELQDDFFTQVGMRLPTMQIGVDEMLPVAHYEVRLRGTVIATGAVPLDSVLVELHPAQAEAFGLEVSLETIHPLAKSSVFWAPHSPALRRIVEAAQIRVFDFMEFIALTTAAFLNKCPEELLGIAEVHTALKQIEKRHPGLLLEAFQQQPVNIPRLTELLQELVRERVNIRDFQQVVEAVAVYCATNGVSLSSGEDLSLSDLVASVRLGRRRQLIATLLSPRRTMKVITMSAPTEECFEEMATPEGALPLALDPELFEGLRHGLQELLEPIEGRGLMPVAVLCRAELRAKAIRFMRWCGSEVPVVTFEELDTAIPAEPVGVWQLQTSR